MKKRVTFSEPETQLANVSIREKSRNCLYANVSVGDKRIQMLVDTGSPISILSEEIANKLGFMESQMRESDIKISGVDSSPIEVFGSVDCEIGLDSQKFAMEMTVADIKGFSGILGMDFMEMYDVRLNIRRRTMVVLNQEVSLERVITRTGARLVLANVEKRYRHRDRIKHTNANSVRFTQSRECKAENKSVSKCKSHSAMHSKTYQRCLEGQGSKVERWLQDDEPDAVADVYDERVDDDDESDDVGDDADDNAPSTPVVQTTRRGRVVKPREIYSP